MSSETVISCLKKKTDNYIIGCDIYTKEWIAPSLSVDVFYQVPLVANQVEYLDTIHSICINEKVECIIPLIDIEVDLLSVNSQFFIENKIRLCIPNLQSIEICRDKKKISELFKNDPVVRTIPTFDIENLDLSITNFPFIAKPVNGRSSEGVFRIFNSNDLEYFRINYNTENYIIQPLLNGDIFTADFIRNELSNYSFNIIRKELLRTINGAGITVQIINDPQMSELVKYIGEVLKINGCVNFEFLVNNGRTYLMDVNPRFSAGISFSVMLGYDFVNNHLKCFFNNEIDPPIVYSETIITKRYFETITL
jgi:carbamoyl-phosphate synthase large subunit